ncbi:hypothetical protein N8I77_002891 [Diaporthe amygdali]|uniref:BTB domain-containing protein n=1 Tax=Phomopsis amygdali TaxID=1214568 RepID=A0AAD9SIU2_PHOAM|nr:hypothetical protein N8I77_002891 [Diaporthe amygdali]
MTSQSREDASLRASDLKLLETGNFADIEIICRGRTFKVHKAVVCSRSLWFEKALTGGFAEAATGKVKIDEEEPEAIEVMLRYIYGGAVDMVKETSNEQVFKSCVDMYRAAHFLLLSPLLPRIRRRLGGYCDQKLKQLCTRSSGTESTGTKLWAADLATAIRATYKADIKVFKKIFMEFVWAGRWQLLGDGECDISYLIDDTPGFIKDMLHNCATKQWLDDPVWAPKRPEKSLAGWHWECASCKVPIVSSRITRAAGQVFDPFTLGEENRVRREWCRKCSDLNMIPWRQARY